MTLFSPFLPIAAHDCLQSRIAANFAPADATGPEGKKTARCFHAPSRANQKAVMPDRRIWRRLRMTFASDAIMEFTALFLAVTVVMLIAWRGARPLALSLYAAVLIAAVATYLHHATDALKLSF